MPLPLQSHLSSHTVKLPRCSDALPTQKHWIRTRSGWWWQTQSHLSHSWCSGSGPRESVLPSLDQFFMLETSCRWLRSSSLLRFVSLDRSGSNASRTKRQEASWMTQWSSSITHFCCTSPSSTSSWPSLSSRFAALAVTWKVSPILKLNDNSWRERHSSKGKACNGQKVQRVTDGRGQARRLRELRKMMNT